MIAWRTNVEPAPGNPLRVAIVERRHDLALEQLVERLRVGGVDGVEVGRSAVWPSISQPFWPV